MFNTKTAIAITLFIVTTVFSGISSAACTKADGAGKWNVYVNLQGGWIYCPFTVAANGAIAPGSRCTYSTGLTRTVMVGSSLAVAANCTASAKVVLSGGVITTFNHMTFSRDKLQFSGVGSDNFKIKFTYNGIKL
jgi:hypothetical protein